MEGCLCLWLSFRIELFVLFLFATLISLGKVDEESERGAFGCFDRRLFIFACVHVKRPWWVTLNISLSELITKIKQLN